MPQLYALALVSFESSDVSCDCLAHVYGNSADQPGRKRHYASDMTDAEWSVIRRLLPMPAWLEGRGGRPEGYCHRQILDAVRYVVDNGIKWRAITVDESGVVTRVGNQGRQLADPEQFMGFSGNPSRPDSLLFRHHDLHIEVQFDRAHQIGSTDKAGVSNVVLESALSTIMDLEGSVAAVDAGDKVVGYRNWLRLMQGTLTEDVTKDGRTFRRTLNADRVFTALSGESVTMPGGVAVQSGRPDIS